MTNEQLAAAIQQGQTHLMEQLLKQNRGMIYALSSKYWSIVQRIVAVDMDDITQAAALGMMEAVPNWDSSRGSFLTVSTFYMRKRVREALGIRTTKERIENKNPASLYQPTGEEEDILLVDMLSDPTATDPEQAALDRELQEFVREAVNSLPEAQRRAIQHRVYGGKPFPSTAGEYSAAMAALKRNKRLRRLWDEYKSACYWSTSLSSWKHSNTSSPEAAAIRREELLRRFASGLTRPEIIEQFI